MPESSKSLVTRSLRRPVQTSKPNRSRRVLVAGSSRNHQPRQSRADRAPRVTGPRPPPSSTPTTPRPPQPTRQPASALTTGKHWTSSPPPPPHASPRVSQRDAASLAGQRWASGPGSQAPRQEAGASLAAHHQRPTARYRRQGSRYGTIARTATVSPGRTVPFLRIPRSHAQEGLAMTLSSATPSAGSVTMSRTNVSARWMTDAVYPADSSAAMTAVVSSGTPPGAGSW
jgi:hypothetical protein